MMKLSGILTRKWVQAILLFALLGLLILESTSTSRLRQQIRNFNFDYYNIIHPRIPGDSVIVVDIDDASLSHADLGQWPWPRTILAQMVTKLKEMGASVIAFDMVFPEPDRTSPDLAMKFLPDNLQNKELDGLVAKLPSHDQIFADSIESAGNVVTGFAFSGVASDEVPTLSQVAPYTAHKKGVALENYINNPVGPTNTLPVLTKNAAGSGSFYTASDPDGVIRRVPVLVSAKNRLGNSTILPGLSLEAIRVFFAERGAKILMANDQYMSLGPGRYGIDSILFPKAKLQIPLNTRGEFLVHFAHSRPEWFLSAYKVLDGTADPALIKGKIVLIGTSAVGLKDIRSTPLDAFRPGVELHVNIIDQVLQGKFLYRPIQAEVAEATAIFLAGLMIIVLAPFVGAIFQAFFVTVLISVGLYAGLYLYTHYGLQVDVAYASLSLLVIFIVSSLFAYMRTEAERRRVRQAFGLYIAPSFMEELARNPDRLKLGGEVRELTVMFTDIRSFTSISESMSPEELIQLMNDFLTPMSDLVMSNRGTIDKYMGDAMMAFWNAPLDDADHARHACTAALQMNEALKPINDHLTARAAATGRPQALLQAGIGINTGPASVGNMGSRQRFAYSALGDTVNLASRLEGQTKAYGVDILVGASTYAKIHDFAALELDLLRVKGKNEPINVYTLLGMPDLAETESFKAWKAQHDAMISLYREGAFDDVDLAIEKCMLLSGGRLRSFYDMYRARIHDLKTNRPSQGWDGVYTAQSK